MQARLRRVRERREPADEAQDDLREREPAVRLEALLEARRRDVRDGVERHEDALEVREPLCARDDVEVGVLDGQAVDQRLECRPEPCVGHGGEQGVAVVVGMADPDEGLQRDVDHEWRLWWLHTVRYALRK